MGEVDPGRPQELPMKNSLAKLGTALAAILFLGFVSAPALADDGDGVARISVVNGAITLQHGDKGDTEAGVVNAPVSVGDYLSTGSSSHAEVQLDNANFVRVSSDAQMRFSKLDPTDHQLQLAAGTAELRILRSTNANVQIDTPSITIRPEEPGSYRATVDRSGNTIFTVRSGQADLLGPQGSQTIDSGTTVLVKGSSSNPQVSTIDSVAYDDFDSWNSQRDQYEQRAYGDQYANQGIVGIDDLNSYGHWVWVSDYGNVWVPYGSDPGWAPYQDGRWAYTPYYGWTWVGYEPWGWAPYHYGRWLYAPGYGWAWWPGPVYGPVAYCPGAVAFFGYGSGFGFSIGFSFGNVAWVPLAPYEPFYPWWGRGFRGGNITNINITNVNITNVNITKVYRNARGPHAAIAAMTLRDFQSGSFNHHYLPVQARDLRNVGLVKSTLPIHPGTGSLRFADRPGFVGKPAPVSPRFHIMAARPTLQAGAVPRSTGVVASKPLIARHNLPVATLDSRAPSSAWSRFGSAHGTTVGTETRPHFVTMTKPTRLTPAKPVVEPNHGLSVPSGPSAEWSRFNANRGLANSQIGSVPKVVHDAAPVPHALGSQTNISTKDTTTSPWSRFNNTANDGRGTVSKAPHNSGLTSHAALPQNSASGGKTPTSPWARFNSGTSYGSGVVSREPHNTGFTSHATVPQHSTSLSKAPASPWSRFNGTYNDHPAYSTGGAHGANQSYSRNPSLWRNSGSQSNYSQPRGNYYSQPSGNYDTQRPQYQRQSNTPPTRTQKQHHSH